MKLMYIRRMKITRIRAKSPITRYVDLEKPIPCSDAALEACVMAFLATFALTGGPSDAGS